MYYIYKIENLINHKKYIGLTNNISRRRIRHFTDLRCKKHDNSFLQKEFIKYGEENFSFDIVFQGNITYEEISEKEKEYIKFYDSYLNGYNQNEGGNFGPSNGGSHLIETDILSILSAIEFMSRPGQILGDIFNVSRTTISRIKKGVNHCEIYEKYWSLSIDERKAIYKIFCDSTNFYEKKVNTTIIQSKRHLTEQQVHLILLNEELNRPWTIEKMMKYCNVKSNNTIYCILRSQSYKDFILSYSKLTEIQKLQLASLLGN